MPEGTRLPIPLENAYWVEPGRFLAGEYPGATGERKARARIRRLLEAGIDCFLDLTVAGELEPYERWLPGTDGLRPAVYRRMPIPDHALPERVEHTATILDEIDAALGEGRRVYVHCRAGIGRTNLVVGCWLVRRGLSGEAALARLNALWQACGRSRSWPTVPETPEQVDYVRQWTEARADLGHAADAEAALALQDRYRGLLLGIAAGDACGQATVHRRPGSFPRVGDLLGGGPFDLPAGAWTDETAMALCLADSLTSLQRIDPDDQVARYVRWQREGYLSSTGQCLGISAATARALARSRWSRKPLAGSHDPAKADKEPLGRIGPAVALFLPDPEQAIEAAVEAARVTHQAPLTLDAVRYLAALLVGALQGTPRAELLGPMYSPVDGYWSRRRLKREVETVARGSWTQKSPPRISGGGQAIEALEAALWSLARAASFREAVLAAVNLGGDADCTGALVGQLAGALHGASGIPAAWRSTILKSELVAGYADRLLELALRRVPDA